MKTFSKMKTLEILKKVQELDREDPENAGYRTCPACMGASHAEPEVVSCDTCHGKGEVNLYDI